MRQIYEYHPAVGFRFIPETKVRMPHEGGGYLLKTNETGFRYDKPFDAERNGDRKRVLLFGDSFTAGEGVSNGQRYSDFLEKYLPGTEFYNFGLPATGLDQHYLIYKEFAQGIEHDLLIIAVFVENVRRVGSRYRHFYNEAGQKVLYAKPYFTLESGELKLNCVPPPKLPLDESKLGSDQQTHIFATERFPKLKRQFNDLKSRPWFDKWVVQSGFKDGLMKWGGYQPITEYSDPQTPAWQVMRALIERWIREHQKPVLLMPIPLHHHVYGLASPKSYQARLSEATVAGGGRFMDPLPALRAHDKPTQRSMYFPVDGHLTKAGHDALARAIAPQLSKELSVTLAL
jgi:hypothetical protein